MNSIIKLAICLSSILLNVSCVTSITHRRQLITCLNVCQQEVTNCIAPGNNRCLKSYHTCLAKAKDFYRCVNSSKIKQLVELSRCIEQRCEEVEEQIINNQNNPLRILHRKIPFCWPWIDQNNKIGIQVIASQNRYGRCEFVLCQLIVDSRSSENKDTKGSSVRRGNCNGSKIDIRRVREAQRKAKILMSWIKMSKDKSVV